MNPRTIDFYTNRGLLEPVERSEGGHRFYGAEAAHRIRAIKALQSSGLSLTEVQARLAAVDDPVEVLADAEKLREELARLEQEVARLGRKIADLPPGSVARSAAERAMHDSMLTALALAHRVASFVMEARIPSAI